jgi:HSP20 family protein
MTEETKEIQVQEQEMIKSDGSERIRDRVTFIPRADIYQTDEDVVLILDMPGVSEDTIDVTLEKNILTINANAVVEIPTGYSRAFAEYAIGDFERSFRLTDEIDREAINAAYKNGVLRLTLPKAEEVKARKIAVKAA